MSNEEIDNVSVPLPPFISGTLADCCRLHFTSKYLPFDAIFSLSWRFVLPVLIIARLHIIIFALPRSDRVCASHSFSLDFLPHAGSIVCAIACVCPRWKNNNNNSRSSHNERTRNYLLVVGGRMTSFETNNSYEFRRMQDPMIII